jgi:PIN domain
MITSIDTNVLLDVLLAKQEFNNASVRALETAASEGSLVICDLVYAELCIHFDTQRECDAFLLRRRNSCRATEQGGTFFGRSYLAHLPQTGWTSQSHLAGLPHWRSY